MIDEFPGGVALREPGENEAILLVVLRQSGNVQRTEVHTTRAAALKSAQAVFRRMKQIDARIWVNTDLCADLRRPFHHGRGSREGRVTAGVCMEVRSLRN